MVPDAGGETQPNTHTPYRILIVDDEVPIREMLAGAFTGAGYEVLGAGNVGEAMELLQREAVDAVLSDVQMGSHTGHDLVRWIYVQYPNVICMLMSGLDDAACKECPFPSGCKLLRKPFKPKEAVSAVNAIIFDSRGFRVGQNAGQGKNDDLSLRAAYQTKRPR